MNFLTQDVDRLSAPPSSPRERSPDPLHRLSAPPSSPRERSPDPLHRGPQTPPLSPAYLQLQEHIATLTEDLNGWKEDWWQLEGENQKLEGENEKLKEENQKIK